MPNDFLVTLHHLFGNTEMLLKNKETKTDIDAKFTNNSFIKFNSLTVLMFSNVNFLRIAYPSEQKNNESKMANNFFLQSVSIQRCNIRIWIIFMSSISGNTFQNDLWQVFVHFSFLVQRANIQFCVKLEKKKPLRHTNWGKKFLVNIVWEDSVHKMIVSIYMTTKGWISGKLPWNYW